MAQLLARHSDINLTMNTYTTLDVLDQAVAVEALPPVPTGEPKPLQTEPPLRATGTDGRELPDQVSKKVPTMVPRGAENGATGLASRTLRLAPECSEEPSEGSVIRKIELTQSSKKNAPFHTSAGDSAPPCSEVPEVGLEPTRPCGHWILKPLKVVNATASKVLHLHCTLLLLL